MFPLKAFYWGQKGVRDNYKLQIRNIVESAYRSLGETPVIVGECGIPMDMKYVAFMSLLLLAAEYPAAKARPSVPTTSPGSLA